MNNPWLKRCRSLHQKKYRQQEGLFLVEGEKNVLELIKSGLRIERIFATMEFISRNRPALSLWPDLLVESGEDKLIKAGTLKTNNAALAVAGIPRAESLDIESGGINFVLDGIQDPGNLGTIMRLCDWYGADRLICSDQTVDAYNPKTVAASMGAFARIVPQYVDLPAFLSPLSAQVTIHGTYMGGRSVHQYHFPETVVVVIGSESHGISEAVGNLVGQRLGIPGRGGAESLNAALALGILADNIFRQRGV